MTSETDLFLAKACDLLTQGHAMLAIDLWDAAGRTAYLAAFHAAQAFIFVRSGRIMKSHHGVHTEFLRLSRTDQAISAELRQFLSQAYNLKSIADYETGLEAKITRERATHALQQAAAFIQVISAARTDD